MSVSRRMWDVPAIGVPLILRGQRDVAVVLEVFRPTHLDVWTGRAIVLPPLVAGTPSDAPLPVPDDPAGALVATAVLVRHAGNVAGRRPAFGARRRRLDALLHLRPPHEPVVGIVVDAAGPWLGWARGDVTQLAERLSDRDWRSADG